MSDRETRETDEEYIETERDMDEYDYDENPSERGKWVSAVVALIGLLLVIEAWLFNLGAANFWNDIIIGVALLILGGYNYYRRGNEEIGSTGAAALVALLGLWLIIAPFVFGPEAVSAVTEVGFWSDVILGLVTLILGIYSAYEARDTEQTAMTGT